jgi:hypothetical protein
MKGFYITIRDEKFRVKFYHDEKKNTVVCVLEDQWGTYTGKAKCNTEAGDVYDEKEGEERALQRSIWKWHRKKFYIVNGEYLLNTRKLEQQKSGLFNKWSRIAVKNQLTTIS